ncbi:MAG TPA: hypothetical protein VM638_09260, partial [Actinomycetota bacterium]|nr:hypothetical protein [Actinomycetota bacterium]
VAHMKNTFHTKAEADAKFVPAASFFTYKQTLLPSDVEPLGQFGNFRLRGRCEGDGTSMRVRVQIRTTVDGAVLRGEESGHFRPLNTGDGWVRWSAGWYNDEGAPRLNNPVEPAHAIGPDGTAIYGTSTLGANIPEGTCTVAGFIINM